jgi:serine phosphatase RsbU (regulator of sigma subunit)
LPERLPKLEGLDLAVRYAPGADGVDIGGDWYDAIVIDDRHVLFVVGDVSGRGLRAATVMASLRYAIHAYAAQGDDPATILNKLTKLMSVEQDGHFATVLCGAVDVTEHRVTIANAGHPDPLVVTSEGAEFLRTMVGPPIGVNGAAYTSIEAPIPPRATLVGFTDGLYERRREHPDEGLGRVRDASRGFDSLDELLDGLLDKMAPGGGSDDTAILGIRWLT